MITMKVVAQKRWWVSPLLSVLKAFVYARIVKEKHIEPLTDFIARFGFKFRTEK
ncbi:hypothetical protein OV081_20915 [Salmonella enterica subsp. enterica serovar 1,4,[5],12:i:-]|jgi:hypothetical protein|uniref:hypothetical protein n=1 Tax=Salmonella enterica TaxID=28901 RepID=UPI0020622CBF|nr:hypothetical protein [Salmonella enterica]MCY4938131.1 hypothetical protein [Salmonella enterica subsp. enterica serovar 1,4,[5],12:i:-]DAH73786.1 MAG TPA: hypothetical protein [Caudoviricetes sp.]HDV5192293.1 hypothetical protein [Salmonella enterica subsp. enterica serovar Typhimurium]MCY5048604.1 hypothetical protein [Salmonella enterica subsp. enterica serovar 1,4,[5],12:i:-]MCY5077910.1 hypothetical protein [Salmonella enterica subsp. enterica serovar 1,4,[5],12:i:-]